MNKMLELEIDFLMRHAFAVNGYEGLEVGSSPTPNTFLGEVVGEDITVETTYGERSSIIAGAFDTLKVWSRELHDLIPYGIRDQRFLRYFNESLGIDDDCVKQFKFIHRLDRLQNPHYGRSGCDIENDRRDRICNLILSTNKDALFESINETIKSTMEKETAKTIPCVKSLPLSNSLFNHINFRNHQITYLNVPEFLLLSAETDILDITPLKIVCRSSQYYVISEETGRLTAVFIKGTWTKLAQSRWEINVTPSIGEPWGVNHGEELVFDTPNKFSLTIADEDAKAHSQIYSIIREHINNSEHADAFSGKGSDVDNIRRASINSKVRDGHLEVYIEFVLDEGPISRKSLLDVMELAVSELELVKEHGKYYIYSEDNEGWHSTNTEITKELYDVLRNYKGVPTK